MKKLFLYAMGAAALITSGAASAISITTGLTLNEPTGMTTLCLVDCTGTITVDVTTGPITAATNGQFAITALNILITDGDPAVSTGLTFGNLTGLFNVAEIVNGEFTDVYASLSNSFNGLGQLNITGNDWGVSGFGPSGALIVGGGSATAIPEPSTLALFGIALVGFGVASRRKKNKI